MGTETGLVQLKHRQLILGTGTGRCGTKSLTHLLNAQPHSKITHEIGTPMPWSVGYKHFSFLVDYIMSKSDTYYYGDIAPWHMPYTHLWVQLFPEIKMVCLKRDREDTVGSWMHIMKNMKMCPVIGIRSKHWRSEWDFAYSQGGPKSFHASLPDYDLPPEKAYHQYYTDFYETAKEFQVTYPSNFKIFKTELVLNTEDNQNEMFHWLDMDSHINLVGLRVNTKRDVDNDMKGED
jgi:hypothetical protein